MTSPRVAAVAFPLVAMCAQPAVAGLCGPPGIDELRRSHSGRGLIGS